MDAYISFRLDGLNQYLHNPDAIANMDKRAGYWMRRYGATLGYNGYYLKEYISTELMNKVRIANPAKLLTEGFMLLQNLTFDEGRAEEKPEFVSSVLLLAVQEGHVTRQQVRALCEHAIKLSEFQPEYKKRWMTERDKFFTSV